MNNMEKIYISGRIKGLPMDVVMSKFDKAEACLKAQGYEVINPLKSDIPVNIPWEVHAVMDILLLISCKSIYLLSDWSLSRGATLEKNIAELTGMTIVYEKIPAFQHIKQAIADGLNVSFYDIVSKSREQKHVFARMIFAQHCREEGATTIRIAKEMKRSHATIIYYLKRYPDDYRYTPEFKIYADTIKKSLSKNDL